MVYDASLPGLSGGVLTLNLSTPFTYNPANGNLLLDVTSPNADNPVNQLFLDFSGTGVTTRLFGPPGSIQEGSGLVTGFSTSTIPEPSTWAMMLLGFAGLGIAGYSRSRKVRLASAA